MPIAPNVEGEVVDCAIEARETVSVLVVVERSTRLGETLVGEGVLELLDLGVFVKVVLLDFAIFVLYSGEVRIVWF